MSQPADLQAAPTGTTPPPRWIAPWLALLAPLYVISPLALLALPQLRKLPTTAKYVLAFYAISQQLPALFAPEPLLASVLALARTLLMFGLMGVGVALGRSEQLKPFAIGLGVVFVTAVIYSVLGGADVLTSRLGHPYMTSITLGLGGAFGVWIALFTGGKLLWRVPLGLSGLAILLLSGSRGPLAAALVGCLAGFTIQRGRQVAVALLIGAGLLTGGLYVGERLGINAFSRLVSLDTTGRDIIWYNTITIIKSQPLGGVGSYRVGTYLTPPGNKCTLFINTKGSAPSCPEWIKKLGNPWLIAHSLTLQQLAETGPLGFLGLLALLGFLIFAIIQNKNPLAISIIIGLLVTTITDNTILIPSPFFGEIFWLIAGCQIYLFTETLSSSRNKLWFETMICALLLSFLISPLPLTLLYGKSLNSADTSSFIFLFAPNTYKYSYKYNLFAQMKLKPGGYRLILQSCQSVCRTITESKFTTDEYNLSPIISFSGDVMPEEKQRLQLLLYPGAGKLDPRPLAQLSWLAFKE